jgi:hypothetical protein
VEIFALPITGQRIKKTAADIVTAVRIFFAKRLIGFFTRPALLGIVFFCHRANQKANPFQKGVPIECICLIPWMFNPSHILSAVIVLDGVHPESNQFFLNIKTHHVTLRLAFDHFMDMKGIST